MGQQERHEGEMLGAGEASVNCSKAPGIVRSIVGRQEDPDQQNRGLSAFRPADHGREIRSEGPERSTPEPVIGAELEHDDPRVVTAEQPRQPDTATT